MAPDPEAAPFRAACIDIGSNGIRCVAAEHDGSATPKVLLQERAPVRLGASVFRDGAIAAPDLDAAVSALVGFKAALDKLGVSALRVVATSAVRDARNRKAFRRRVLDEAGLRVEVISGGEEARLVHLAVAQRIPMDGKPWLLVDVGGGSVEASLARADGLQWTASRAMGAVRLLEHYRSAGAKPRKARRLIEETVETLRLPDLEKGELGGVAGTGGNIEELARLAGQPAAGGRVQVVPLKALQETLATMQEVDDAERARRWDLKPDRADVIVPAGLVYAHMARLVGADAIHVPHVALKDGVLAELMLEGVASTVPPSVKAGGKDGKTDGKGGKDGGDGKAEGRDGKAEGKAVRSALGVGRRFRLEESHGVQVQRLALSLFDQLQPLHQLTARDRVILATAAVLHDVGRHVGDRKHHKHSYYLISQSEILGLTKAEVGIAAQVARYHRKAEPRLRHEPYAALAVPDRVRVDRLSALLRVADALDRQHRSRVQAVRADLRNGTVRLELEAAGDVSLEEWALARKGGLFERVFAVKVELAEVGPHG